MELSGEDTQIIGTSHPRIIEIIGILLQIIFDLRQEVQDLRNRNNLNSSNSSIPPSKDPLNKKAKKDRNSREKTGRLPGGQPGHLGKTLLPKNKPDKVIDYKSEICSHCSSILPVNSQEFVEERQEVEIPVVKAQYIAHRIYSIICPHCSSLNEGEFPLTSNRKSNMGLF
jgi:transposase